MTPEERELIADLFDRLAQLERNPRDPEAERAMREGLARAPNAVYALVQTVLLQDEALKRADQRIAELEEASARGDGAGREPRGFLDSMRDNLFGRDAPHGSVPSVRPGDRPAAGAPDYRGGPERSPWGSAAERTTAGGSPYGAPGGSPYGGPGGAPYGGPMQGSPMGGAPSGGHSFLGTAAAVAAGAIGGGLLLGGIRSALGGQGGQGGGPFSGAFDHLSGQSGGGRTPFDSGGGSNELARDAGIDDIGRSGRAGFGDTAQSEDAGGRAGFADTAQNEDVTDDSDFEEEGDGDFDGGDSDTDTA